MLSDMTELIEAIHGTAGKLVLAVTGGGSTALSRLLAVPGASRTVIEGTVPYDPASLADYIGGTPDQACSGKTARALAMASFQRAGRFEPDLASVFGIGCTAALVTDRERRGNDRCFIAVQSLTETREYTLTLSRENRDRAGQERLCADLVIYAIALAFGLNAPAPEIFGDESLDHRAIAAPEEWQRLFSGDLQFTGHEPKPALLFPGAFNPIHEGHKDMIRVAERLTGHRVLLEISAFNVDKPPLDYLEMQARANNVRDDYAFTFTNAPTFVVKSSLFGNATFMVGVDTLVRIADPRYYGDSIAQRDIALEKIRDNGNRFLVFGRLQDDRFIGLADVDIPDVLREISTAVSEDEFRSDVSSTEIRRSQPGR